MIRRSVLATRIRSPRDYKPFEIEGELIGAPAIGKRMLVVGDFGTHLVTSPIERVLETRERGGELYVETRNSVYRVVRALTRRQAHAVGAPVQGGSSPSSRGRGSAKLPHDH
jgi:hypothetical protein